MIDWGKVRNFHKQEWKTDSTKVNEKLVYLVDEFTFYMKAHFAQSFCIIHVAYDEAGHTDGSQHYTGEAVDLHFVGVPLIDQYFGAERFPFTGIGIYPYWKNPGLHLDIRTLPGNVGARWYRDEAGFYKDINRAMLVELVQKGLA